MAAKGVDRLGIVADGRQALSLGRKPVEDVGLERVGVLILINKDAIEELANGVAGRLGSSSSSDSALPQTAPAPLPAPASTPEEEQIVVIEDAGGLFAVHVAIEEPFQIVLPFLAPRKLAEQHVVEFFAGIDATAVDGHARSLFGESLVGLGQVQIGADDVHQVFGVGPIVDGELGRQADRLAVAVQQTCGDGVEGSAPDAGGVPGLRTAADGASFPPCGASRLRRGG